MSSPPPLAGQPAGASDKSLLASRSETGASPCRTPPLFSVSCLSPGAWPHLALRSRFPPKKSSDGIPIVCAGNRSSASTGHRWVSVSVQVQPSSSPSAPPGAPGHSCPANDRRCPPTCPRDIIASTRARSFQSRQRPLISLRGVFRGPVTARFLFFQVRVIRDQTELHP
ncbi:hypothetical protein BDY21DRAFT_100378 [Lineolata rhizophorae]|uniref:Uncharacterized protein n=1 Tax=Lineolata rhizophorae TaxID=578093 RepID=A0A6A6NSE3_9PEZI|nr:hypothetical protein BDY21DRAFT_100378 [Lineolata rhizophorae]